jgi:enoyl-CoA hydratase
MPALLPRYRDLPLLAELGASRSPPAGDATSILADLIGRTPLELLALKKQAINKVMEVQGFSAAVMAGAEFDALAHASADARAVRAKMKELGWRAAADWYQGQVPQGDNLAPD